MKLRVPVFALLFIGFVNVDLTAQVLQPQNFQPIAQGQKPAGPVNAEAQQAPNKKPYELTSRIHLQQGTNRGYLIVQVNLADGNYVYSLTQAGQIPPSKVQVAKSGAFRLLGKFNPDRPAKVIAKDKIFNQRVEKHRDQVQFFAPIEISTSADVKTVVADVVFDGQVCTDKGFCMPVKNVALKAKFAGYFQRKAANQNPARKNAAQAALKR